MSVEHYSAEFQKLSRYAPYQAERFRDGLALRILERIIFIRETNYTEMLHMTTMAEKGIRAAAADYITRKWSTSIGALPLPASNRQTTSSSAGSQGRRSTYSSPGSGSNQ